MRQAISVTSHCHRLATRQECCCVQSGSRKRAKRETQRLAAAFLGVNGNYKDGRVSREQSRLQCRKAPPGNRPRSRCCETNNRSRNPKPCLHEATATNHTGQLNQKPALLDNSAILWHKLSAVSGRPLLRDCSARRQVQPWVSACSKHAAPFSFPANFKNRPCLLNKSSQRAVIRFSSLAKGVTGTVVIGVLWCRCG